MKIKYFYISLALLFVHGACNSPQKQAGKASSPPKTIEVPDFNADSAYAFIARQLSFGPRVPGSDAHSECALWLENKMKTYTNTVEVQSFKARAYNGEILRGKNIIASFNPENNKRILLCAHWDSRPYADHDPDKNNRNTPIDGANDGASGVGVLIEMARNFNRQLPGIGVDIIFFDLEDYGPPEDDQSYGGEDYWGLGSQFWSNNPHKANYHARYGILLDMVGVKDATFLQEGFSMMYAPSKVKKVWNVAAVMGYDDYFVNKPGGYITDDHYYVNKIINIPTINIIHLDNNSINGSFFEHWHTINDNIDHIDKTTLNVVGRVVMQVVYHER
ncbi:MAG: M28 family peptidase [Bacteroidales bacterium]|nr:M28 family peptidase [Bacteroidales bacterium]